MSCISELALPPMDLVILSGDEVFWFPDTWNSANGVTSLDLTADIRNWVAGASATAEVKPAVQLAAVRIDRPDAPARITAGTAITGGGVTPHFEETISTANKAWWRAGWSSKLTAGAFVRAQGRLYIACKECARNFKAQNLVFNPTNDTTTPSIFPITPGFAAHAANKAKAAIIGMDNLNNLLQWDLFGRSTNDPMNWPAWTQLGTWNTPSAGNFEVNSGELDIATALSLGSNHWGQLGFGVRKANAQDANGRCVFQVIPSVILT